MVIQHNLSAANTGRRLSVTTGELASSVEKLSSGYRINRAADDAAGLAISEKMRSQIRGLERASANAQDGISLVQTAEGALNEVHSILQRMNELAIQAANDTNTSADRSQLQLEVDQLLSEIDRIHSTTQFNTMNLLDGSFSGKNLQVGSLSGQRIEIGIGLMSASALGLSSGSRTTTVTGSENVSAESVKKAANGATAATNDPNVTLTITDPSKITRDVTLYYDSGRLVSSGSSGTGGDPNNPAIETQVVLATEGAHKMSSLTNMTNGNGSIYYLAGGVEVVSAENNGGSALTTSREGWYGVTGSTGSYSLNYIDPSYVKVTGGTLTAGPTTENSPYVNLTTYGLYFDGWAESPSDTLYTSSNTSNHAYNGSVPKNFEETFGVQFSFPGSAPALGTSAWITLNTPSTAANNDDGTTSLVTSSSATAATDGISVMSFDLASDAMERIQSAIDIVSTERAKLGAIQNRLEHTIANLDTAAENASAAESRIRDTDMSDEMVTYSKNQILAEAGRSMLAQANQTPQGVLSLLT